MDMHLRDLGLDLLNSGAASKDIGNELEVRDIRLTIRFGIFLILSVVREIEQSGGEAFLVHSLHHQLVLDHSDSDVAIFIGKTSAGPSAGNE